MKQNNVTLFLVSQFKILLISIFIYLSDKYIQNGAFLIFIINNYTVTMSFALATIVNGFYFFVYTRSVSKVNQFISAIINDEQEKETLHKTFRNIFLHSFLEVNLAVILTVATAASLVKCQFTSCSTFEYELMCVLLLFFFVNIIDFFFDFFKVTRTVDKYVKS